MKNASVVAAAVTVLLAVLTIVLSWFVDESWDNWVVPVGIVVAVAVGTVVQRRLSRRHPRV